MIRSTLEAVALIEGGEQDEEVLREAWQYIVDNGVVWQFQGWYGRAAAAMIEAGELSCSR